MRIKRHHDRNEYALTADNIWVRNLCSEGPHFDINNLIQDKDCQLFLENEVDHRRKSINNFSSNTAKDVVIVSDGFGFSEKQHLLENFDSKITVIAVNGALRNWKYSGKTERHKRPLNWYVVNNPYPECKKFLPTHGFFPPCLMAARTDVYFADQYKGRKYLYSSSPTFLFRGLQPALYLDDYRNPICAAISLSYLMKARKILLFCCDNSFADERPGADRLENGLWSYPQQQVSNRIIDTMAYWLKTKEITISDYSSGAKYEHVPYIDEERLSNYFGEEEHV